MNRQNLKQRCLRLCTCTVLVAALHVSPGLAAGLSGEENLAARGIAMAYFPGRSYVNIREFSLTGTATVEDLKTMIDESSYCDSHFIFEQLESVEERIFKDGDVVNAECHLVTRTDDTAVVMQDLLSGVLARPVGAGLEDNELRASFDFPDGDVVLDQSNAEGLFTRSNGRAMIIWKHPLEKFSAVWVAASWAPIAGGITLEADLESPPISPAQLELLKADIRAKAPAY